MIVKNESKVIRRCLASVKEIIDYWVIVDTGSEDGTQEVVKEFLKDIPGELHQRPWVDFAHNRNEALRVAKNKADYILFMDADEKLVFSAVLDKKLLDKDYYFVSVRDSEPNFLAYERFLLINNHLDWVWKDILHEYLVIPPAAKSHCVLPTITCFTDSDGFRSQDPKKYLKDVEVLKKALEIEPGNSRYLFYLAQSYHNAEEYELAIQTYDKRASLQGIWEKEVFWSIYSAAKLREALKKTEKEIVKHYSKAYQRDPSRAEPLFRLASYYNRHGNPLLGYALSKLALSIPLPKDGMYVEEWIYDFGLKALEADSAFLLGKQEEAKKIYLKLLEKKTLPEEIKNKIKLWAFIEENAS